MYAILNYFDDPKLSEQICVKKSDNLIARYSEFNLTAEKEYEILEVNNTNMITVKNDKGDSEIYTVECFKS